jgi:CheY-like chemotaxis protein
VSPGGGATRYGVLVVDDDLVALETTVALLEDDHDVVGTSDVGEAFELLEKHAIHVIVSDWRMPGIDGVEFLRRAMRSGRPIACLLVSGAADQLFDEVPLEHRRLIAVLKKPFSPAQLRERVAGLGRIAAMKGSVHRMRGGE